VLTMNPLVPHRELFERKAASYRARWPWLRVARADHQGVSTPPLVRAPGDR